MAYSYPEIRTFSGLFLQQNSFDVPDGAMEVAENVVIQNDNQISKLFGFYTYYTAAATDSIESIWGDDSVTYIIIESGFSFVGSLYKLDLSGIDFNAPGTATLVPGETFDVGLLDLKPKTQLMDQIRYFTTNSGIFRIDPVDSTGQVVKAGVPTALDMQFELDTASALGPLPADSQTSYRYLVGRTDANGKLLLSAPSDIVTVALLPGATAAGYTRAGGGPYQVIVTSVGHGLETGDQIIVTGGSDTDVNGTHTVGYLTDDTFSFTIVADPGASGTLDYDYSRTATLEATIPRELTDGTLNWFIRFYRTTSSASVSATPTPDFKLISESVLSQSDLNLGVFFFTDDVDAVLAGAELYTNPNSQEGELQANLRPPSAGDMCEYKNYMIYADVIPYARLQLQLVDTSQLVGKQISVGVPLVTPEIYIGVDIGFAGNRKFPATAAGAGTVTVTYASTHGFSNGFTVLITEVTGTVPAGRYVISGVTATTFAITPGGILTASALSFEGLLDASGRSLFTVDDASSSIALQIAQTAQYLVTAINRRAGAFYANYISGPEDAPGKIKIERQSISLGGVPFLVTLNSTVQPNPFNPPVTTSSTTTAQAKHTAQPHVFYVSKYGEPDAVPLLSFFPVGEASAAILQCFALEDAVIFIKEDGIFRLTGDSIADFTVSALDRTIYGLSRTGGAPIQNSILALTNQGVVTIGSASVTVISRRIDDLIQQLVSGYSLDDEVALVVSSSITEAAAVGYESGRLWMLSVQGGSNGVPGQTYIYNVVTQTWTTSDLVFKHMAMAERDKIYGVTADDTVLVQRKYTQRIDYTREYQTIVANADSADDSIVYFQIGGGSATASWTPQAGDVILYLYVINRIASVSFAGGIYTAQMMVSSNLPTTSVTAGLYQAYTSTVRFAPFHAGQVGREKQFAQLQVHCRQFSISRMEINYQTDSCTEADTSLEWYAQNILDNEDIPGDGPQVVTYGWGDGPWGLMPWGAPSQTPSIQNQSIFFSVGTRPGIILRTYVPSYAQRGTFIQPAFTHAEAGEQMLIQAVSWSVRGYGERTTR